MYEEATVTTLASTPTKRRTTVKTSSGSTLVVPARDLFPANPPILDAADDLTKLSYLNEPSILHDLRLRYASDDVYTRAGPVLIAVNPFKRLDGTLYGPDVMRAHEHGASGASGAAATPPHVYATAAAAYRDMMASKKNQAVVVSGESGAGKTETTKIAMRYLASVGGGDGGGIERRVLQTNPILEAFGNAKTLRNDNSSRFGKLIDIAFDGAGKIKGASVRTYLLEKSRVTHQAEGERGYHVFYQLCAGASAAEREAWGVPEAPGFFSYLSSSSVVAVAGVDDAKAYLETKRALAEVGASEDEISEIFKTVAAVLWLGNVHFDEDATRADGAAAAAVTAAGAPALATAAKLLGVDANLLERALTTRKIHAAGESIVSVLNAASACEGRDALAKAIFAALFDSIVASVNEALGSSGGDRGGGRAAATSVSILDIYGFEYFQKNSFEQLCINYANERLQQQFNKHMFKLEQEEYEREGIDWTKVDFEDNQACVDVIERRPMGILSLLDEQCAFPKATDDKFAQKMATELSSDAKYARDKRNERVFKVSHYAGEVSYDVDGFLDKNRDAIHPDLMSALMASSEDFVCTLAELMTSAKAAETDRAGGLRAARAKGGAGKESVGARFKTQLSALVAKLDACAPHFIRCVKPNSALAPSRFDDALVLNQLRCCGVLEVVRIARQGYPTRYAQRDFAERFGFLLPSAARAPFGDAATDIVPFCHAILQHFDVKDASYQFGKTKLFLRAGQIGMMEDQRARKLSSVVIMQSARRGCVARAAFLHAKASITRTQARARGNAARVRYARALREHRAAMVIQAMTRGRAARRACAAERAAIVTVQMAVRRWTLRAKWRALDAARASMAIAEREAAAAAAAEAAAAARAEAEAIREKKEAAAAEAEARRAAAEEERARVAAAKAAADAETARLEAEARVAGLATEEDVRAAVEAAAAAATATAKANERSLLEENERLKSELRAQTRVAGEYRDRLFAAESEWSEEMAALQSALCAVRGALDGGEPPSPLLTAAVAAAAARGDAAPSPGTPPRFEDGGGGGGGSGSGSGGSGGSGGNAAATRRRADPVAKAGAEHVGVLQKEFDTRTRVFEDDADFIVEVKEGVSDADLDPDFELKSLGARFENWKKDFKDRLKETRAMLKKLERFDDFGDDAHGHGDGDVNTGANAPRAGPAPNDENAGFEFVPWEVARKQTGKRAAGAGDAAGAGAGAEKKRGWGFKRALGLKKR